MNRSGADAERLGRCEDSCAGHQLRADTRDDIGAHGATPEELPLRSKLCAPCNGEHGELGKGEVVRNPAQ